MKLPRKTLLFVVVLAVITTAAAVPSAAMPLDKFRVIVTRALPTGMHKAGEDFGESKLLTDILDKMASEGWQHVSMQPLVEEYQGVRQTRFLVVNRR